MNLKLCKRLLPLGYRFIYSSNFYNNLETDATINSNELVLTEKLGNTFTIAINRPEKRNCVNLATAKQLTDAFLKFESDETAHVAVLYGKGGNFCAGFDLGELASKDKTTSIDSSNETIFMGPSRMLTSKPVIGAINGYAVAGGMELALLCDLRVMEETAVMGVFCRRFGVPLLDGGTVRLSKIVGLSRALDLILTGRPIESKEALEMGLINRHVACGTALGQALQLASNIGKFPQECVRADRKSVYYSAFEAKSLQDALEFEYENSKSVINKESIDGAKQFVAGKGKHGKPL